MIMSLILEVVSEELSQASKVISLEALGFDSISRLTFRQHKLESPIVRNDAPTQENHNHYMFIILNDCVGRFDLCSCTQIFCSSTGRT